MWTVDQGVDSGPMCGSFGSLDLIFVATFSSDIVGKAKCGKSRENSVENWRPGVKQLEPPMFVPKHRFPTNVEEGKHLTQEKTNI